MDATYIYDNFGEDAKVHVVQDSDELMQVSLTSEKVLTYYPLAKHRMQTWPVVGRVVKSVQLMSFVRSEFTDPLRRKIFVQPVRIHADPINGQWKQVEARAQAIVARAIAEPSRAGSALPRNRPRKGCGAVLSNDRQEEQHARRSVYAC